MWQHRSHSGNLDSMPGESRFFLNCLFNIIKTSQQLVGNLLAEDSVPLNWIASKNW